MKQSVRSTQAGFLLISVVIVLGILGAIALTLSGSTSLDNAMVSKHADAATLDYVAESGLEHAQWQLAQNSTCAGYTGLTATPFGANSYSAAFSVNSGSPVTVTATGSVPSGATNELIKTGVKAYQAPQSLTLQPGSVGKDLWLTSGKPMWNYGAHANLNVNDSAQRAMLQFDLSALPANVRITAAVVEVYLSSQSGSGTVAIHRVTNNWVEGTCTGAGCTADGASWDTRDGTVLWSTPGADHDVTPIATEAVTTAGTWHRFDISNLAERWNSGELANNGILLIGAGSSSQFASSDHSDAALHPKILISYACECGATCSSTVTPKCDADYVPGSKLSEFSPSGIGSDFFRGVTFLPEGEIFKSAGVPAGGLLLSVDSEKQAYLLASDGTNLASCTLPGSGALWSDGIAYVPTGSYAGSIAVVFNGSSSNYVQYVDSDCSSLATFSTDDFGASIPSGVTHLASTASGTYDDFLAIADRGVNDTVHIVDQNGVESFSLDVSNFVGELSGIAHLPSTDKLVLADAANSKVHVIDIMNFTGSSLAEYALDKFGVSGPEGIAINGVTCDHVVGAENSDNIVALNESARPIAHWKLDETGGLLAVDTAGGHHGNLINGPSWNPLGEIDGALGFDGSDDYVSVPHSDSLSLTSSFTISAWVRNESPSIADSYRIISKESVGASDNFWLSFQNRALWLGVGGSFFSPPVTVNPNVWYHIAVSFDDAADSIVIYLNGTEVLSQLTTASIAPNTEPLLIGASWQDFKYWDGFLDDVLIYEQILTPEEIADLALPGGVSGSATFEKQVIAGDDDAEQRTGDGYADISSTDLELANDLDGFQSDLVGMRFTSISIPQGAAITNAYIQFQVDEIDSGSASLGITGENTDDAAAFTTSDYNISGRTTTTASISWEPQPWDTVGDAGLNQQTPNIAAVIQEIVNRSGWTNGNALVVMIKGTGTRSAESYNGDPSGAPLLHIEYVAGDSGGCSGTYRDEFNSPLYSGNDGSLVWASDWQEINESDGPTLGDERVFADLYESPEMPTYQLFVRDNDGGGEGVMRELNLSGATKAMLTFDFKPAGLDNGGDYASVQMSRDGTDGPWSEVARFAGPANETAYQAFGIDVSGFNSENAAIRIVTSSKMGGSDYVFFDNLQIECN